MEKALNQRVIELMKWSKLNTNQFAAKIGSTPSPFYLVETEGRIPSLTNILRILSAFPDVSAEWLMRGTGKITVDTPCQDDVETLEEKDALIQALKEENNRLHDTIVNLANSLSNFQKNIKQ